MGRNGSIIVGGGIIRKARQLTRSWSVQARKLERNALSLAISVRGFGKIVSHRCHEDRLKPPPPLPLGWIRKNVCCLNGREFVQCAPGSVFGGRPCENCLRTLFREWGPDVYEEQPRLNICWKREACCKYNTECNMRRSVNGLFLQNKLFSFKMANSHTSDWAYTKFCY